jgi:hypothetical protein
MKSSFKIIIITIILVLFSNCTTPKYLTIPSRPYSTVDKNRKVNINEFKVNPLTTEDNINDLEKLADVFRDYIRLNDSYFQIQKYYPDASLKISIEPGKTIKRTWILDLAFLYPCPFYWPLSPRWGQTTVNITLTVDIPSIDYAPYNFSASNKYTIYWYPYYNAGKILTSKFALTYLDVFTQISKYDFIQNWTGKRKITALLDDRKKIIQNEQILTDNKSTKSIIIPEKFSDVDKNIPLNNISNSNTFALIIGNEDYSSYQNDLSSEVNVDFAEHDARIFRDYTISTLGVPEQNIVLLINGTSGQMNQALTKINLISKNSKGEAMIILYYAGHGLPDEVTKEPYLIPVDVSAKDLSQAIKLKDVFSKLTEYPNNRITVFLDACFSGGARNQGLLATRAVKIKPNEQQLKGNLVVFTASSGMESSLPYKEKYHGMFTYFLLKKFQESKGNITYRELSDYLKEKVALESVLINSKEQNTQTNVSPGAIDIWENWNFLE